MNDLLFAVKGNDRGYNYDPEAPAHTPPNEGDREMQMFLKYVEDIKVDIANIAAKQRELQQQHERSKAIVRSKEMQRHREEMQATINHVSTIAHSVKAKIEALDQSNEQSLRRKGCGAGSATERTRTTITGGLRKKLKDQMSLFTSLRAKIQDEYREVVERRVYTVTGQRVPEEEIDMLIENGESENIFQKAILEQGRGRVLETLAEIQERHRAVKDLEHSLVELHQVYLDMAVLVESQGEMLDNIEKQVGRSVDYVQSGTAALQKAKTYQRSKRKMMCWVFAILLVIILIIIIAVVKPWELIK